MRAFCLEVLVVVWGFRSCCLEVCLSVGASGLLSGGLGRDEVYAPPVAGLVLKWNFTYASWLEGLVVSCAFASAVNWVFRASRPEGLSLGAIGRRFELHVCCLGGLVPNWSFHARCLEGLVVDWVLGSAVWRMASRLADWRVGS